MNVVAILSCLSFTHAYVVLNPARDPDFPALHLKSHQASRDDNIVDFYVESVPFLLPMRVDIPIQQKDDYRSALEFALGIDWDITMTFMWISPSRPECRPPQLVIGNDDERDESSATDCTVYKDNMKRQMYHCQILMSDAGDEKKHSEQPDAYYLRLHPKGSDDELCKYVLQGGGRQIYFGMTIFVEDDIPSRKIPWVNFAF